MDHGKLSPKAYIYITDCIYDSRDIKEEGWKDYQSKKTRKLSIKKTEKITKIITK